MWLLCEIQYRTPIKCVLAEFPTRLEAEIEESRLIAFHINDRFCRNRKMRYPKALAAAANVQ